MQLFYNPNLIKSSDNIIFSREESKHISKVLRQKEGDILKVTNGKGLLFSAKIINASPRECTAMVLEVEQQEKESYHLHLAVAPTKMNDRYEWFLEKSTEIGIQEITPIFCEHSERKVVKLNRFERVLQSAIKQSLNLKLPKLNEPVNVTDFIKSKIEGDKFIAYCDEENKKQTLKSRIKYGQKATVLIGPEGDFSSQEIQLALKHHWQPVSLGKNRLRTETAAIVACHTVALANQD